MPLWGFGSMVLWHPVAVWGLVAKKLPDFYPYASKCVAPLGWDRQWSIVGKWGMAWGLAIWKGKGRRQTRCKTPVKN